MLRAIRRTRTLFTSRNKKRDSWTASPTSSKKKRKFKGNPTKIKCTNELYFKKGILAQTLLEKQMVHEKNKLGALLNRKGSKTSFASGVLCVPFFTLSGHFHNNVVAIKRGTLGLEILFLLLLALGDDGL